MAIEVEHLELKGGSKMEFIHLVGADDVQRAGNTMQKAAKDMQMAANSIQESLVNHSQFMDDWLYRLRELFESKE